MSEIMENLPTMYNQVTGEKIINEQIVSETADYQIVIGVDGLARKKMKYHQFWSHTPVTDEEVEQLFKIMNDSTNELVKPLSECNGDVFSIKEIYIEPYESLNEETLTNEFGVTCTIKSTDGNWYATSSKVAYYQLQNMFKAFGFPSDEDYRPIKVTINLKKEKKGKTTNIVFIGREPK